jgi:hypothetical protein
MPIYNSKQDLLNAMDGGSRKLSALPKKKAVDYPEFKKMDVSQKPMKRVIKDTAPADATDVPHPDYRAIGH